jgi:hypothetical protein
MSHGAGRWLKYRTRFDPARTGNESLSPLMKAYMDQLEFQSVVQDKFQRLQNMEEQVRQVLNDEGVATITYGFYLDYGREMFRLVESGIAGDSLQQEAWVLAQKWVSRGLTQPTLVAIALQVFNITIPPGP